MTRRHNRSQQKPYPIEFFVIVTTAGAVGFGMLIPKQNDAQGTTNTTSRNAQSPTQIARAREELKPVETSRRSLDYYTKGVRENLFTAPVAPKPKAKPAPKPAPKPTPPPPPIVPPVIINPFAEWSYSGTVKIGDEIVALLENSRTKEGHYIRVGESVLGAKVEAISDQMVTLRSADKPYLLAKADTIQVTHLEKSAPYLSGGAPGQPMPGQPNAMPTTGFNTMPGSMGGGSFSSGRVLTLPNGATYTGDRANRLESFMNRRFEGNSDRTNERRESRRER